MNNFLLIFCIVQVITIMITILQDWVHFPPLTDMRALEKAIPMGERIGATVQVALYMLISLLGCYIITLGR